MRRSCLHAGRVQLCSTLHRKTGDGRANGQSSVESVRPKVLVGEQQNTCRSRSYTTSASPLIWPTWSTTSSPTDCKQWGWAQPHPLYSPSTPGSHRDVCWALSCTLSTPMTALASLPPHHISNIQTTQPFWHFSQTTNPLWTITIQSLISPSGAQTIISKSMSIKQRNYCSAHPRTPPS